MSLYYLDTHMGCGIRRAKNIEEARRNGLIEVGTYNFRCVRKATPEDIANVRAMGGRVPAGDEA